MLFLPIWIVAVRSRNWGWPRQRGISGGIPPRRLISRGTGSHLAMRVVHKHHNPLIQRMETNKAM